MKITKKIRYFIDNKIPEYLYKMYPNLIKFIYGFVDFLDKECAEDILNIDDNLDIDKIKDTFIDAYFEQYCKDIINSENYALTDSIKKEFIMLGKMWFKNKGKTFSLDIALKYLSQYFITSDNSYITELDYKIYEFEKDWLSDGIKDYSKPYTYTIRGDFPVSYMHTMLEKVNPVGFAPEYQFESETTENWTFKNTTETSFIGINYDWGNPTELYDISTINETFEVLTNRGISDSEIIENYNIFNKMLRCDGQIVCDGSRICDGVDKGIHNDFEILVYKNGELIETYAFDIGQ